MAQLPVIPVTGNSTQSGGFNPDGYANLFVEVFSDNSSSMTNLVDGSAVTKWINIKNIFPFTDSQTWFQSGDATTTYSATGNAISGPCVNFSASTTRMQLGATFTTNQPTTLFIVEQSSSLTSQTFFDCLVASGNRNLVRSTTTGSLIFAGSSITSTHTQLTNWIVWSAVFNGANSYWRTNGVLCGTGNPGAQGIGQPMIANDSTAASQFKGKMCAVLAYGQAMNTNDLQAVESALKTRFGVP